MPPGMRILLTFIQDNRLRLVDWFNQFDKDHSGGISREEFKIGLKETGLVMTQVSFGFWFDGFSLWSTVPIQIIILYSNLSSCLLSLQRQLDRLIDFIDINDDGEIEYR